MPEFAARVASVRITPSRTDDVNTVVRIVVEAHDVTCDPLVQLIDKQVAVRLELLPLPLRPMDEALEQASLNGHSEEPVQIPSNARRRRGTHADPGSNEDE